MKTERVLVNYVEGLSDAEARLLESILDESLALRERESMKRRGK